MRILYLSPWFPYPLDTGFRIRVYHQLRAMARHHKVTLLTLDPEGWTPARVEPVESLCQKLALIPRDPFRRGRLRTATRFLFVRPIVNIPFAEMTRLVCQLHTEQPFDVAIASSTVMAHYALALSGIPHVLEEHNSHSRWMHERYIAQVSPLQRLRCWVSWRKSIAYESRLFPRFDLVTMASEQDAATSRSLLRDGRPPVTLVPNGVDCAQFRPGLATPQPDTLVFTGSLAYDANYEAMRFFLGQVYPNILRHHPGARLVITGSTRGVDLSGLALSDSVTLTGFVEDIRPLIAGSCVSVVPILSGGGTRIKILESMALGTPVVATTKGADGLDVTPDHDILIADEPAEFASRVVHLLEDASLHRQLADNARHLVEKHYNWVRIGQRFVGLVESVFAP